MFVYKIAPFSFPKITLFDSVSVDNCIHFKRTTSEFIAFFIIRGDMYLMEDEVPYHLKEGDWILLTPNKEHYGYKFSDHCSYYFIHFQTTDVEYTDINDTELQNIFLTQKKEVIHGTKPDTYIYVPKYFQANKQFRTDTILHLLNRGKHYYNTSKTFNDYQTCCLFLDLVIHLSHMFANQLLDSESTPLKRSTLIVYRLLDDLNHNYMQKYSSSLIETAYNCNFDYINRKFKAETGKTIFVYLTEVRISNAKMLLTMGNLSMKEIAQRVGFDDIYYFSNLFKKQTGYSPTQYQRLVLGND